MAKHRLRTKESGWGWYPMSWHGWVITLSFILLYGSATALFPLLLIAFPKAGGFLSLGFFIFIIILTTALLYICYTKRNVRKLHD